MPKLLTGLYALLAEIAVWSVLFPLELLHIAIGRAPAGVLEERLGRATGGRDRARPPILVHAVSAGEMAAAGPLVARLGAGPEGAEVVLTTGNAAGRRAAGLIRRQDGSSVPVSYLPWDRPRAVDRWLGTLAPAAVVIVETEIWPGLFLACRRRGIPLVVVNGRIYPRDVARYRIAKGFFRSVLACPAAIGVQSAAERDRFLAIGAPADRVVIGGDLKRDAPAASIRSAACVPSGRPLVVAGSTHPGEERLLLAALAGLRRDFPHAGLVVAPRHPRRTGAVARLAASAGFRVALHSEGPGPTARADVVVVDEIGPLAALYAAADVALIGGSFVPMGGHNPLEAAAHSRAIVIGPSTGHVDGAVELLEAAGGIVRVRSADAVSLEAALSGLLADTPRREAMGAAARAALDAARGPSEVYAGLVRTALGERGANLRGVPGAGAGLTSVPISGPAGPARRPPGTSRPG